MRNRIVLLVAVLFTAIASWAQGRDALRISEVMVVNENGITDDFGERVGWIELQNSSFAPMNISSVFISTKKGADKKDMYAIPLGDEKTKIGKRQYVVFFADGKKTRGTFHTSFTLKPGKDNWIGLYDANGETLLDSVLVPANLPANSSYARLSDNEQVWAVRNGTNETDDYITPGAPNVLKESNDKIEKFAQQDKHGFAMAAMAMCIVFSALLVLALAFLAISKIGESTSRKNKAKAHGVELQSVSASDLKHDSGEEIAAIVMALHQHLNAHDTESTVLTINKVKRAYSPWSSKIYNMRQLPK